MGRRIASVYLRLEQERILGLPGTPRMRYCPCMAGTLFLVATPIGNLGDITYRAVRILTSVNAIACEDTRHTRKLLDHYSISTPLISLHEHNEADRSRQLVTRLCCGESIALVSDAGTPLVSDPGYRLVSLAVSASIPVVPVPGPSALLAALSASGLPTDEFHFLGFLAAKASQRRKQLESIREEAGTVIFYEAPHRMLDSLADVESILGPARPVVLAREVTKVHEEFLRGPVSSVLRQLSARPTVKGEFTLVIGRAPEAEMEQASPGVLRAQVEALIQSGSARMDAIKQVAHEHRLGKREVYRILES